jgi:hypothetical protein
LHGVVFDILVGSENARLPGGFMFAKRAAGALGRPAFPMPSLGGRDLQDSGASCRGIAKLRLMNTGAPHSHSSSPGLTGRSSIPEAAVIEPRGRGELDTPHARGMTTFDGDAHLAGKTDGIVA